MAARIRHVTIDCADPYELSGFWQQVTGWDRYPDDHPGDPECLLVAPEGGGPGLLFIQVPERKAVKNRIHFDLEPQTDRDDEAERLIKLGARLVDDQRLPDGQGWMVLADPEGNEFCVVRPAAEREPAA
jgi:predicted enzyme related to lactoylglutathione lyase